MRKSGKERNGEKRTVVEVGDSVLRAHFGDTSTRGILATYGYDCKNGCTILKIREMKIKRQEGEK